MEQLHITNVFKDGAISKEVYTRVWIDLINQLQAKKSVVFSPQA